MNDHIFYFDGLCWRRAEVIIAIGTATDVPFTDYDGGPGKKMKNQNKISTVFFSPADDFIKNGL